MTFSLSYPNPWSSYYLMDRFTCTHRGNLWLIAEHIVKQAWMHSTTYSYISFHFKHPVSSWLLSHQNYSYTLHNYMLHSYQLPLHFPCFVFILSWFFNFFFAGPHLFIWTLYISVEYQAYARFQDS